MKWQCVQCGDCCELFALYTLGFKCPLFTKDRKCKNYKTRSKLCRVSTIDFHGLDRDEYLNARCKMIRALKKWRDEVGENESTAFILSEISASCIE